MEEKVHELVSEYKSGSLSRRQFLRRATLLLGGAAAANALLLAANGASIPEVARASGQLTPEASLSATMAATGQAANIETSVVQFAAGTSQAPGYLARPTGDGPFPAVVVIQEWWGVDDHIKSVVERFAGQGYAAITPDLYRGKVAKEPNDAQQLVMLMQMDQALKDVQGAVDYLAQQSYVSPKKPGVIGFCAGGRLAILMSYQGKNVGAVVSFYGSGANPTDEDLKNVSAPMLRIYGDQDQGNPIDKVSAWEPKLKEYGKISDIVVYKGAQHAFFNDTRPSYNKEAAQDAWKRTLDWFGKYLTESSAAATMAPTTMATQGG
jgi:carboxymethylenebutenolidase